MSELIYEKGHIWEKGNVAVSTCWWTRNETNEICSVDIKVHTELAAPPIGWVKEDISAPTL